MEFSVLDRLALLEILPEKGHPVAMLRIIHDLRYEAAFSEEELAALNFRDDGKRTVWNRIPDKEIEIGIQAKLLIRELLKGLNEKRELKVGHLGLWDLFECDEE